MVLLGSNKPALHQMRQQIGQYLRDELNLTLKHDWQVFPVDVRGIDFLGYRFFHNYTLVRKSIVKRFKKKHKQNSTKSIPAYWGWFKWADTHNLVKKYEVQYG